MNEITLAQIKSIRKYFPTSRGIVKAVDGVSLDIKRGTVLCLVGESGCGKTTLGRITAGLLKPTSGEILFEGKDTFKLSGKEWRRLRCSIQIIFQNPDTSLDPSFRVKSIVLEALKAAGHKADEGRIIALLKEVGLGPELLSKYPHQLSGGQRQRVSIARALAVEPKFIVADEPVSMLDVSIRAQVLNLLIDLQENRNLTYLFITHDLPTARYIGDEIAVMYLGKLVEVAPTDVLFESALHPYTKALLSAILHPSVKRERIVLKGEVPSSINPPAGCRFRTRCMFATECCTEREPEFKRVENKHFVACHLV